MTGSDIYLAEAIKRHKAFQGLLLTWGSHNYRELPWRRERTPYRILLAEVVLRRTTATAAAKVYDQLVHEYPDIKSLSRAAEDDLRTALSAVGYQNRRARILKTMAVFILDEFGGKIPDNTQDLLRIPHVGPYTAAAIRSLGYGVPAAMVDSNVLRIVGRVFAHSLPNKPRFKDVERICEAILAKNRHESFNLALLDLGAFVCQYGRPRHEVCPISSVCDLYESDKGVTSSGYVDPTHPA
jgi:A/G-specific adenine glycosylase